MRDGCREKWMAGYPRMMSAIVSIHKTDNAIIAMVEDTMQDNI